MKLAYSILPSSKTSLTFAIRLKEMAPSYYITKASYSDGFVVVAADYVAGYGMTPDEACEDAVYVLENDLLSHDRLMVQ